MSVNNNQTGAQWDKENAADKAAPAVGLAALFGQPSMSSNNRHLKEVNDVAASVKDFYAGMRNSTTASIQVSTIPEIENMTAVISPVLPGLCFYKEISGKMYIMGVLFSNDNMVAGSEFINVQNQYGNQTISFMSTPADAANGQMIEKIKQHYQDNNSRKNLQGFEIINMVVVDLEMYKHSGIQGPEDRIQRISAFLTSEWEEAILVRTAKECTEAGARLPSPFIGGKAYGPAGNAEARITAVTDQVGATGMLTPSNMEIRVNTITPNQQYSNNQNSKEVVRVRASVSLTGVSYLEHLQTAQQSGRIQQFVPGVYPQGYHPLRPVITLDSVQAGEQMMNNGGLYPFIYGLYILMCTNNNYAFAEALRRQSVGARGNLSSLEVRIQQLLAEGNINMPQNARIILDDKKMGDIDLVNQWIRQNVAQHAVFQSNLVLRGSNSSVNNALVLLSGDPVTRQGMVKTFINVIDSISNGYMSKLIAEGQGWTMSDPVLHRTSILGVNGLAKVGDKELNTLEIDEMMLHTLKGKNGAASIAEFLRTKFGDINNPQDLKVRAQNLRVQVSESLFDNAVHINQFSTVGIWDPKFMSMLGKCFDQIGTLHVSGNHGSFRNNNLVFQQGAGLATYATVGANNPNGLSANQAFGNNISTFG